MGMQNQAAPVCAVLGGQTRQCRSESECFSLTMTRVSVVRGELRGASAPRNLAKMTLVQYLCMELHKGDLKLV